MFDFGIRWVKNSFLYGLLFLLSSCLYEDPEGSYLGEVKDWVYEVFEGNLITDGKECRVELLLSQSPSKMSAEIRFAHPQMKPVSRLGKWEVGDGERIIRLDDNKKPGEFFLIKRGVRYAFQSIEGLRNDDGSPLLLMRNLGKSRKASYPIEITFGNKGGARVAGAGLPQTMTGEWNRVSDRVTVTIKLPKIVLEAEENIPEESYKYFLRWSEEGDKALVLEKMVVMRPFVKEDGSKRQSWMSSLIFSDRPILVTK